MSEASTSKVKEAFKAAVRSAVAKGNHARWGEAESTAVIEALFDLALSDDEVGSEGFDAIRANVARVVNPSAFAQYLDKLPKDHPASITRPARGSGGSKSGMEV
jgi:hypothetical protein